MWSVALQKLVHQDSTPATVPQTAHTFRRRGLTLPAHNSKREQDMGEKIISIQDAPGAGAPQTTRPQALENKLNVFRQKEINRRMALKLILSGFSFRAAAKRHPGREDGLVRDVRAELTDRSAA
jgi:hypothetical protein